MDKKIDTLMKRMKWHVQAVDADGVHKLVDEYYDLEIKRSSELPELYKTDFADNLEFQRFALHHVGLDVVEQALKLAEELSDRLYRMTAIKEEDIDQANNVLHQYFFEKLIDGATLIDRNGKEHSDWRSFNEVV